MRRDRGRYHHHGGFDPLHGGRGRNTWFGHEWGPGRRAKRGDVRASSLALLDEKPMHGYDLIRELEQRSAGMWRPSPGSIYPTLQLLEDEGLVTAEEHDGKRVYSITDAGKRELAERRERGGDAAPWEVGSLGEGVDRLRQAMFQTGAAAVQVARTGSDPQRTEAAEILSEARKKLYALLAEG